MNGIEENVGVELDTTPQPFCGTCLSPGQSFIFPVLSNEAIPTIYVTNFASIGVNETIGITFQY
jgi:hypothetical protein